MFHWQIDKLRLEFESCYPALCSASGITISAIQKWRESFDRTLPFMWRGQNYMARMLEQVMDAQSQMLSLLRLSDVCSQHLVVHGSDVALSLGYSLLGR
jgi:hypothetical protein